MPVIKDFVVAWREKSSGIPHKWTNNCESMNHLIKVAMHWEKQKLSDRLRSYTASQSCRQRRWSTPSEDKATSELTMEIKRFQISKVAWLNKTDEDRDALVQALSLYKPRNSGHIVSTDGALTIPKTATTAKKPGQRKHVQSDCIVTVKTCHIIQAPCICPSVASLYCRLRVQSLTDGGFSACMQMSMYIHAELCPCAVVCVVHVICIFSSSMYCLCCLCHLYRFLIPISHILYVSYLAELCLCAVTCVVSSRCPYLSCSVFHRRAIIAVGFQPACNRPCDP